MKAVQTVAEVNQYLDKARKSNKSIGFVPTMGALHEGHLTLVRTARKQNEVVVSSIFVNPIQFNNPEDLAKYPRTIDRDIKLLDEAGCDLVFIPSVEEMYPEKVTKKYDFGLLERVMEGYYRPGHFNGVAIVVKRLFDIVGPDKAYFGVKDFQQLAIIKAMVSMENLKLKIVPCTTVREPDGLAMSSRNMRLSKEDRKLAPEIYKSLQELKTDAPRLEIAELKERVIKQLKGKGIEVEYIEIADTNTLQPITSWDSLPGGKIKRIPEPEDLSDGQMPAIDDAVGAFIACYLGGIRLIDNIILFHIFAGR